MIFIIVVLLFSSISQMHCMEKKEHHKKDVFIKSELGKYCQQKLTILNLREKKPRRAASLMETVMMRQELFDAEKKTITFSDYKNPQKNYSCSLKKTMKIMRTALKAMHWYSRLGRRLYHEDTPQGTDWFIKRHAHKIYESITKQKNKNHVLCLFSRNDIYIFQLRRFYFFLMGSKFQHKSFIHHWVLNNQKIILENKPELQDKTEFLTSFIQHFKHDQRLKALLYSSIEEASLKKLKKALKKKPKLDIHVSLEDELIELTQEMFAF